ncbi:ATP-binding cassette domain-containing protein [Methanobrevibacter sp.]|uniref:ATP-binding cassette domain-containing protein n=1 Tax=Methanobrevibacter sp. TaxID=66852 RepID=UPI00388F051B
MSLKERIKRAFKREESQITGEEKKEILPPVEWKYEDMILFAPPRKTSKDKEDYFYIYALDKNNEPIKNEIIDVKIGKESFEEKTDENGHVKILMNKFRPKLYPVTITYPNGEYSQIITSRFKVNRESPKPKPATAAAKKEKSDKVTSIYLPEMKMYINNEGKFYARLRDYEYKPIEGEELKFTIEGETYTAKTDYKGFAKIDIKNLDKGTHNILVEYEGSSKYDPSSKTSKLEMLVRNLDREVVIEVKNLSMEFKVTKDKIDTLKEFIIRTIKRNKEEHKKIKILDDITFNVYKGDKLGILGFNGAGKSTLLKIMAGIYEPTSGSITTHGKVAPLLELGAGFDKNYTGKNNIFLNGAFLSLDEKFLKEKYDEIVEYSELGDFINYPIKNYSSGMRTKLGFSIATLINPDILIIDEILSVGDIKFRQKSAEKINSMMEEGVTVLLVSHSIKQIRKICDTCIWLENGKIKMQGDANEVCDAYVKGAEKDMKKAKQKK